MKVASIQSLARGFLTHHRSVEVSGFSHNHSLCMWPHNGMHHTFPIVIFWVCGFLTACTVTQTEWLLVQVLMLEGDKQPPSSGVDGPTAATDTKHSVLMEITNSMPSRLPNAPSKSPAAHQGQPHGSQSSTASMLLSVWWRLPNTHTPCQQRQHCRQSYGE